MITMRRVPRLFGMSAAAFVCAHLGTAQTLHPSNVLATTTSPPPAYGILDYSTTTIPGVAFVPFNNSTVYGTDPSLGRSVPPAAGRVDFYAALDIPAGTIIDYIGFNNYNDGTPNIMAVHLLKRHDDGSLIDSFDLDNTPHNYWATDINPAVAGIPWGGNPYGSGGESLILDVEVDSSPNYQTFGQVAVFWRRTVSPAPGTSDFGDVPTSSPQFQFIEALYHAGITAGCGSGNYCPNSPLTRGQMAVFLAKALGLHWPG